MREGTVSKIVREEESDLYYDLIYDKLQAMWKEIELLGRVTKIPPQEREHHATEAFAQFFVDRMHDQGATLRDVKEVVTDAFKAAEKAAQEEGGEGPGEGEEEEEEEEDQD